MMKLSLNTGIIHFIGIGGIGMSGIAEVLYDLGYKITGSDIHMNTNIERLESKGIKIFIGQNKKNIKNASLVVVSSAIKDSNNELVESRLAHLPIVRRADMLAELMRFRKSIAIGGTHGKTTTTSMISSIMVHSQLDPTVINGGVIKSYRSNARLGKGPWMVVEADESDGSFTRLPATIVVVTNIDEEHIDFYGNFKNLKNAFKTFIENIPFYGFSVLCIDNHQTKLLYNDIKDKKVVSYGLSSQANYTAYNLKCKNDRTFFDVIINNKTNAEQLIIRDVSILLPGKYNVVNALGAIAVTHELGIEIDKIKKGLEIFKGVERRFSILDKIKGISIIDDYAHHPTEIKSVLEAARTIYKGKIIVIFQPHRFSRIKSLFDKFINSFFVADVVFVTEVFAAGEKSIPNFNHKNIRDAMLKAGHKDVRSLDNFDKLAEELQLLCKPDDCIIFLGAGSISKIARQMALQLKKKLI